MKAYRYNRSGILSFSWNGKDYIMYEAGPHKLPSESPRVQSLIKQGVLSEVSKSKKVNNKIIR